MGAVSGVFQGTADITGFDVQNGKLVAIGTLVGVIKDVQGNVIESLITNFAAVVTGQQASCNILPLVLGPINPNLCSDCR